MPSSRTAATCATTAVAVALIALLSGCSSSDAQLRAGLDDGSPEGITADASESGVSHGDGAAHDDSASTRTAEGSAASQSGLPDGEPDVSPANVTASNASEAGPEASAGEIDGGAHSDAGAAPDAMRAGEGADGGGDAAGDAPVDRPTDAALTDTGAAANPDARADADLDASADANPDASGDADPDASADANPDATTTPDPDASADADAGAAVGSTLGVLRAYSAECAACAAKSGCLDPDPTVGGFRCEQLTDDAFVNCLDTLQCILQSQCTDAPDNDPAPCLCGTSDETACAAGTAPANGACASQYKLDYGTTDVTVIAASFDDSTTAGGNANDIVGCLTTECSSCF